MFPIANIAYLRSLKGSHRGREIVEACDLLKGERVGSTDLQNYLIGRGNKEENSRGLTNTGFLTKALDASYWWENFFGEAGDGISHRASKKVLDATR